MRIDVSSFGSGELAALMMRLTGAFGVNDYGLKVRGGRVWLVLHESVRRAVWSPSKSWFS